VFFAVLYKYKTRLVERYPFLSFPARVLMWLYTQLTAGTNRMAFFVTVSGLSLVDRLAWFQVVTTDALAASCSTTCIGSLLARSRRLLIKLTTIREHVNKQLM
jgi:hypothetical protein